MIFKKIRERLQEYEQSHLIEHDSEECLHCSERQCCEIDICDMADCNVCIWDKAINIINQVEAEYNNGWISAEILPEECVDVLVWFEYFRYGDCNSLYQTWGISYATDGRWSHFVNGSSGWDKLRIIAWQPLPEPYMAVSKMETPIKDSIMNHFIKGE